MGMAPEDIALRWTEERARLGFSQADMARKVSVSRETMRKYENGLSTVSSEVLAVAAQFGFDVQYILTGARSSSSSQSQTGDKASVDQRGANKVVGYVASGGNVHFIDTEKHTTRTIAEVKPGETHISDKQASILLGLVTEIVEIEQKLKKRPASYRSVWGALNRFCGVPKYRLIQAADFDKARKYLDQWMGRLNSMSTAPIVHGDSWRKRKYAYIKVNTKNVDDDEAARNYMIRNFGVTSLTELSNDELERVYQYVAGRRNRAKR